MALLEGVKEVLRNKDMTFTELAALMEVPRPSLHKSLQTESIRYTTLCKLGVVLEIDIAKLVNNVDSTEIKFLKSEISTFLFHLNHLGGLLVRLKYNKATIEEIQEYFDSFGNTLQVNYSNRLMTMDQFEELYSLKDADKSLE